VFALRVAIVGAGWIGGAHAALLDTISSVRLVAVCDPDLTRASALTQPRGARAYEDWETMLARERLDAIWICTPPRAHRGPVLAALDAGIHVYLEKPIARTLPEAEAIDRAAAVGRAVCAVGYQWHASELLDLAREAVAGQAIAMLVGRNYGPVPARPWFIRRSEGGGQLLERGSHHVDLQRAIAGDVESVSVVSAAPAVPARAAEGNIEDYVLCTLHFHSGAVGSVALAWTPDDHPGLYSLDVIAENASLLLDLGPESFRLKGLSHGRALRAESEDPFRRSIEGFLSAVADGDPARVFCTPADALKTLRVVEASERALATGARVGLED
jgi:predicted dehydrogenase